MSTSANASASVQRHASPPLGIVAIVFTVLFCAGLYPVTVFGGTPHFPGPYEPAETIVSFFQLRPKAVLLCAFLHFGSSVPLGIFTASVVSRLRFLGVKAAGATIALYGGFGAAFAIAAGSIALSTLAHPGIAQDATLTQALYFLDFGLGGVGYSVPLGLLMAGVSITALFYRLLPRWIVVLGIALAVCGELSWLNLEFPWAVFLLPLTRFPGFVWLIAAGFALPTTVARANAVEAR